MRQYKSKKQRQEWWKDLTPEQQAGQIEKWQAQKAIKRRNKSIQIMRKVGGDFSCESCFHRKTKSCTDDLPKGCEQWFWPGKKSPLQKRELGVKQRMKLIHKKNPWLRSA